MAPHNIPRAIVLTLGNTVILYCTVTDTYVCVHDPTVGDAWHTVGRLHDTYFLSVNHICKLQALVYDILPPTILESDARSVPYL